MRNAEDFHNLIRSLLMCKAMHVQDEMIVRAREQGGLTREEHWLLNAIFTSLLLDERWWRCAKFLGDEKQASEIEAFVSRRGITFDPKPYRSPGNLLYDVRRDIGNYVPPVWSDLSDAERSEWERTANTYLTLERAWGM